MASQGLRLIGILTSVLILSSLQNFWSQCEACSSCIVINEFAVDPNTGENGSPSSTGEYIEIYNRCSESVDIGCFVICLTDASSGGRGDCITIPAGTTLAGGGVYTLGGYGTNCTGGETDCDWPGLSLNFNWHSSANTVWNVAGNAFYTTNTGNYIGVLQDSGEEISLFNDCGSLIQGVTYSGGSGSYSTTENIGAINGCAATSITISSSNNTNLGSSPGSSGNDEGWERNCDGTYSFSDEASQNPGSSNGCATVACSTLLSTSDLKIVAKALETKNTIEFSYTTSDADRFIVEKSADGKDFEALTEFSYYENNALYKMEDKHPSKVSFYRVAIVLKNGGVDYSESVVVKNTHKKGFEILKMTPNPANENLIIELDIYDKEPVSLSIYDNLGKVVYNQFCSENAQIKIATDQLNSGIYLLKISSSDNILTEKILIQH